MGDSGYSVEETTRVKINIAVLEITKDDGEYIVHRYDVPELEYYIYAMTIDKTVLFGDYTSKLLTKAGHLSIYTHYSKDTTELMYMSIHVVQMHVLMEDIVELLVNMNDADLRILDISIHHIIYVFALYIDANPLIGTDKGTLSIEEYHKEILNLLKESK